MTPDGEGVKSDAQPLTTIVLSETQINYLFEQIDDFLLYNWCCKNIDGKFCIWFDGCDVHEIYKEHKLQLIILDNVEKCLK